MRKTKILHKLFLACAAMLLPLGVSQARTYSADDPAVMAEVVRSRMLPIAMTAPRDTGTLLFSDSPEYAEQDGILYVDKVSGDVRLYFYHVNQNKYPRKIVVMAYNPSPEAKDLTLGGVYYAKPETSYYDVGKELATLYYEGHPTFNKITVPPFGYAVVGEKLNHIIVQPDQLFSGIVNVSTDADMHISAVIMPAAADPVDFIKKQQYLASDAVKLRGTFPGMNRLLKTLIPYSTSEGIGYIVIADGRQDRFLRGYDAIDNRLSEDVGNYGLDYTIDVKTKGEGNLHFYFNSQGGEYAGVAEISYLDGKQGQVNKIVELPRNSLTMGYNDAYAMEYLDSVKAGTEVTIHLMPPGAANLPVRILVVPDTALQAAVNTVQAEEQRRQEEAARRAAEEQRRQQAQQQQQDQKNNKDHADTQAGEGKDNSQPLISHRFWHDDDPTSK